MTIDLSLVKKLREEIGAGIADCKNALTESKGIYEEAIQWLRKKGMANASKKASRVASEGVIGVKSFGKKGVIVEVNSETDFVAKNTIFQSFVNNLLETSSGLNSLEELQEALIDGIKASDTVVNLTGTIGEKIDLRRFASLEVENGQVVTYIHNAVCPNLGKIGVLVALESDASDAKTSEIGKQIAMHIAASNPKYLHTHEVPSSHVDSEKDIFREQAKASGKTIEVIEKMILGRINKFFEEVVLHEQSFVMDNKKKISSILADFSKENGKTELKNYIIFKLGEGIEKQSTNFAEEVAAVMKN